VQHEFTCAGWYVKRGGAINYAILQFIGVMGAMTVVLSPGIIGCLHEEGTDYPDGEVCPHVRTGRRGIAGAEKSFPSN